MITRSIANVVELLEVDGEVVVTVDRLTAVMRQAGQDGDPRQLAYELQRAGWLGRLRTRHAWEFLPGARGGKYGSGDRFIEFRAQHAVDPNWSGVLAMESAASVLGFAQRIPEREVLALPGEERFPRALAGNWRHVRIDLPHSAIATVNGLDTWTLEGLLVGIAVRPSAYKDVVGLGQWLEDAAHDVDTAIVVGLLQPMGSATRQRAAYLLAAARAGAAAAAIVETYPPSAVAWLGPREAGGFFDSNTKVNDSLLHDYLSIGTGS